MCSTPLGISARPPRPSTAATHAVPSAMEPTDPTVRIQRASGDRVGVRTPEAVRPAVPLRIVWVGDLGSATPQRVRVHAGGIDAALAEIAPRVLAHVPGSPDVPFAPTALADFRPDRIARTVPLVQTLLNLAAREASGDGEAALAATGAPASWVRRAMASREAPEAGRGAIDRLMSLAGPQEAPSFRAQVDAEVARTAEALSNDADLAALDRAWRSLAWLARRLDLRGDVRLEAVSVPDLEAALTSGPLAEATVSAALVVADVEIGPSARDVRLAGALAQLGAASGVPVLAGAAPALVGAEDAASSVPPVRHDSDATFGAWTALRQRPEARWLALAYPRVRLAAGAELWGSGALAVAADAAGAHARGDGVSALGRAPLRDLDAADLSISLASGVADDLARHGIGALVAEPGGVHVGRAPSVASGAETPAHTAALSLPASLFMARVAAVIASGGDAAREIPWARVETTAEGTRVVLPATLSPVLGADVSILLRSEA